MQANSLCLDSVQYITTKLIKFFKLQRTVHVHTETTTKIHTLEKNYLFRQTFRLVYYSTIPLVKK